MATVGGFHVLASGSLRLRPGRYNVIMGEPVQPSEYPDRDSLMREVRVRIEALLVEAQAI